MELKRLILQPFVFSLDLRPALASWTLAHLASLTLINPLDLLIVLLSILINRVHAWISED